MVFLIVNQLTNTIVFQFCNYSMNVQYMDVRSLHKCTVSTLFDSLKYKYSRMDVDMANSKNK